MKNFSTYIKRSVALSTALAEASEAFHISVSELSDHLEALWSKEPYTQPKVLVRTLTRLLRDAVDSSVRPQLWGLCTNCGFLSPFLTDEGIDELFRKHPAEIKISRAATKNRELAKFGLPTFIEVKTLRNTRRQKCDIMRCFVSRGNAPTTKDFMRFARLLCTAEDLDKAMFCCRYLCDSPTRPFLFAAH